MAAILIGLKLTQLRHSIRGGQATYLWLGAAVGLAAGLRTVAVGLDGPPGPATWDTLATVVALWLVAWVFVSMAGGDPLRPEQFGLLPIGPSRLAAGLLLASAVGVLPAATLLALAGLLLAAAPAGPLVVLVAIVATPLGLAVIILTAKVVVALTGQAMTSRLGLELAGFQRGLLIALIWIWIPVSAISVAQSGFSVSLDVVGRLARILPTGWPVVAVEAAAASSWLLVIGALAATAILVVVLVRLWSVLLERRLTGAASRSAGPGSRDWLVSIVERWLPDGLSGAVLRRELIAWSRDPRRRVEIRTAAWAALILTITPGLVGSTVLWPFAGMTALVIAATATANPYGMDGTSIWVTLMSPAAAGQDVRARQLAWAAIFGLVALVGTIVPTALSGQAWAWPWVLGALPALLGAAAGLVVLVGVLAPAPLPERRGGDPLDLGDDPRTTNALMLHGVLMTFLVPLAAIPPALATAAGHDAGGPLAWLGLPVGILTGLGLAWTFGHLAIRRLERHGPELLERMRARPAPPEPEPESDRPRVPGRAWVAILLGSLALFPQALAPALLRLTDSDSRLWFVALYLPEPLQVPVILGTAAVGLAAYGLAWAWIRDAKRGRVGRSRPGATE